MTTRLHLVALTSLGFVLFSSLSANAGEEMSLKERKQWAEMSKVIEDKADAASKACGTKIVASFDVASFKGTDLFKESPTAACRDLVYNVENICGTDAGKQTVKQNVTTITCRRSNNGTRVTRDTRTLKVFIDRQSPGIRGKEKGSYSWKSALEEIL